MAKNEINEKVVTIEQITPLSSARLADIDYEQAAVRKALNGIADNVRILAEAPLKLNTHDAKQLGVELQLRNIQYNGTAIRQYLGIAAMLLEQMNNDLKTVYRKRKDFQRDWLLRSAQQVAVQKEEERRKREAERIAEKRAAENMEADAPDN